MRTSPRRAEQRHTIIMDSINQNKSPASQNNNNNKKFTPVINADIPVFLCMQFELLTFFT